MAGCWPASRPATTAPSAWSAQSPTALRHSPAPSRPGARSDAPTGSVAVDSLAPRQVGEHTFAVLDALGVEATLVSDDEIIAAQRVLWDCLRVVAEPGGATAFAALLTGRLDLGPEPVAVVVSGANTTAVQLSTRSFAGSAYFLAHRHDDPLGTPHVGLLPRGFVLPDAADEPVAELGRASHDRLDVVFTPKQTLRMPSRLALWSFSPGTWSGVTNRATSSQVPPSAPGRFSPTTSVFDPGIPQTVSMNSPSTNCRPITSSPSPSKNDTTASKVVHRDPDMVEPPYVCHAGPDHRQAHSSSASGRGT